MTPGRLGLIWAQAEDGVIGADGVMPWHIPEDMAHFKTVTMGHPVIMGRRTWESLPPRFRPLQGRRNIVVTRQPEWAAEGAEVAHDPDAALALAGDAEAWVIGGGSLYRAFVDEADVLEVTEVDGQYAGDTHAPAIGSRWRLEAQTPWHDSRSGPRYRFLRYRS